MCYENSQKKTRFTQLSEQTHTLCAGYPIDANGNYVAMTEEQMNAMYYYPSDQAQAGAYYEAVESKQPASTVVTEHQVRRGIALALFWVSFGLTFGNNSSVRQRDGHHIYAMREQFLMQREI